MIHQQSALSFLIGGTAVRTLTVNVTQNCPGGCGGGDTHLLPETPAEGMAALPPLAKMNHLARPRLQSGGSTIIRTTYAIAGQVIATRVTGDPVSGNNGLFYFYSDHLGSSSVLVNSSNNVVNGSRTWYLPFGGYRPGSAPTQTITDRDFTGQKENIELGLLYYGARFYVPYINRFVSADSIVPDPTNPQSFNRYSYAFNNPIKYIDPSGHDPLDQEWEDAFYAAHGRAPTDIDRQDRLFSLIHPGSGANGEWTGDDWSLYSANRDAFWSGSRTWEGESAPSLDRFLSHLERLSTHYENDEASEFVRAVGLVWGGISYEGFTTFALLGAGAGNTLAQLHEGADGWYEGIVDDTNPAHHWAGGFVGGYDLGKWTGAAANMGREYLQKAMGRGVTQEDIYLGNIASRHGNYFFHDTFGFRQADDPFGKLFETMRIELSESVPWYNR